MIRYVKIDKNTDVIYQTDCFAFFNTVTGRFIELAGDQVFESIEDLTEAWNLEHGLKYKLERLIGLIQ